MSKVFTKDVIRYSAYITEQEGYVKRSDDKSVTCTADKVLDAIESDSIDHDLLDDTKDRVEKWLEYVNDESQNTEYFISLRSEICKPMIDEMKIGLIASSFASFDRHKNFKARADIDRQSEFLGEEGDKVTFNISEYRLVKTGTSKFGNGKWYLYSIKDDNHNIITYFADHDCEFEFTHSKQATATVSKLNTYNEVKQTNVSKLKFL